jgi:hypothetical protein
VPAGPTLTLGLTEGHLVKTTTPGRAAALLIALLAAALATVALAAAGAITEENGLICSINGYPEGECGSEVADADAAAAASAAQDEQPNPAVVAAGTTTDATSTTSTAGNPWAGFALGALILALLIGAAYWIPKRRRAARSAD